MNESLPGPDQLERALELDGVALAPVPKDLSPVNRAAWYCALCRSIDLVLTSQPDLMVGAVPGTRLEVDAETVFVVAGRDGDELPEILQP